MHDHGPLIPPKEDGDVAQLLGCAQAAKQFSDEYLTQVIEEEKKKKSKQDNDNNDAKQHQTKKAKTSQ